MEQQRLVCNRLTDLMSRSEELLLSRQKMAEEAESEQREHRSFQRRWNQSRCPCPVKAGLFAKSTPALILSLSLPLNFLEGQGNNLVWPGLGLEREDLRFGWVCWTGAGSQSVTSCKLYLTAHNHLEESVNYSSIKMRKTHLGNSAIVANMIFERHLGHT